MPLIHAVELGQQLFHFNNDFVSRDFKLGQDFCQSNDIKTANLQFFLKYVQLTPHIFRAEYCEKIPIIYQQVGA